MYEQQFTIFGRKYRMGSYILLIRVSKPFELAFGMFQKGKLFNIPEGDYLYIGSALGGGKTGAPLARRLLRHASRSAGQTPHAIRTVLMTLCCDKHFIDLDTIEVPEKKLRWHVDYLLDRQETEIDHIVIIRSPVRVEQQLSQLIEAFPETALIARRLGAQDSRNSTHLLRITDRKRMLELLRKNIPGMTAIRPIES
jgi:Uri superfamily endonuclease